MGTTLSGLRGPATLTGLCQMGVLKFSKFLAEDKGQSLLKFAYSKSNSTFLLK